MPSETSASIPIAVIGMGCRMPGADDLDSYWDLLKQGQCAISEIPPERLDRELYYEADKQAFGKSYSLLGGYVAERPIDRLSNPLSEEMIQSSDIAHLMMCEVAADACRHAGMDPFDLPERNAGVYVGHSGGSALGGELAYTAYIEEIAEYLRDVKTIKGFGRDVLEQTIRDVVQRVRCKYPQRHRDGGPDLGSHSVSALISKAFGLQGPFLAVDAACASSLLAIALGVEALQQGRIDTAIVGGASYNKWYGYVLFCRAQSMSSTGSRPFDADADGLISADGYGAAILKTLPRALADGDEIYAVIRGIGIASDGRGKSLWAPRREGQMKAIERAYGESIDPTQLQYIECHATSTKVGDATEVAALAAALTDRLPRGTKLPIGSVKANIGHALESAGIAGLLKTVLAAHHGVIPPQINFRTPNPQIDWDNIPFYVPTQALEWPEAPAGRARRAAVNAFGIGGLNVHVVLDDRPPTVHSAQIAVPSFPVKRDATQRQEPPEGVAIVGMGCILPKALTLDSYWELLSSGRTGLCDVPPDRWNAGIYHDPNADGPFRCRTTLGGFITDFVYDWKRHKIPPKQIANANPLQFMLLEAADAALKDAGYDDTPFDRTRTAVVVGTTFGGDFGCHLQIGLRLPETLKLIGESLRQKGLPKDQVDRATAEYREILLKRMPALTDETGSFTASTLASRLTKAFDLMGGAFTIDAADTSSMAALDSAIQLLRSDKCQMVLCASGQRCMDVTAYEAYGMRGLLANGDPRSPFDADADGIVPGEGVGVLVLKRLSDARRDGDKIRAIIRGVGTSTDTEELADAMRRSMERSLESADCDPAKVGMVESARVTRRQVDADEALLVKEVYGVPGRREPILLSSATAQVGHSLGNSGMAALIKAVLELEHGRVPATVGFSRPIDAVADHSNVLRPTEKTEMLHAATDAGHGLAAVSNVDPHGSAYHIVLEGNTRLPELPHSSGKREDTTVPQESASRSEAEVEAAPVKFGMGAEERPIQADEFPRQDELVRFTVVAENRAVLGDKLRTAADLLSGPKARTLLEHQGVFFDGDSEAPAKIAFLFPGQGSQYVGMLRELVERVPAAAAKRDEINVALKRAGLSGYEDLAWLDSGQLGVDVLRTQLSMLAADTIMHAALTEMGIRPDIVAGHSYGEFSALVASGSLSLENAIGATCARTECIKSSVSDPGRLLSTAAAPDVVQRLVRQCVQQVYIANQNGDCQTVVGGRPDALAQFQRLLDGEGIRGRLLSVPCAYHTPLLSAAEEPYAATLATLGIHQPETRFFSSVTNESVSQPFEIRRNLVAQLTTPVLYADLIRRLAGEGVTVFIEVGPNRVLTHLNRQILADRDVSVIATDQPKSSALEQLARVRVLVESKGKPRVLADHSAREHAAVSGDRSDAAGQLGSATPDAKVAEPVIHFDATRRRKDAMKRAAQSGQQRPSGAIPASTSVPTERVPAGTFSLTAPESSLAAVSQRTWVEDEAKNASIVTASSPPAPPSPPTPIVQSSFGHAEDARESQGRAGADSRLDPNRAKACMLEFIVEQTGYPPEMVEFDADLEADLGIDSIKKAQLIGELAESFDLSHLAAGTSDLSLDDFSTLNSILEFVLQSEGKGTSQFVSTASGENADAMSDVVTAVQSSQALGSTTLASTPLVQETVTYGLDAGESSGLPSDSASVGSGLERDRLMASMLEFIVEQTGYPPEMVEFDADLEADLGIDSIKKAQLIGELAESFDLTQLIANVSDLSLDDFPTLDSVLQFVLQLDGASAGTKASAESGGDSQDVSSAVTPSQPAALATTQAPVAPDTVTSPADFGETWQPPADAADIGLGPDSDRVGAFMLEFIVEQTGYPPEMVEFDADLEADLGIDSIKKAQLIGELAESFDLTRLMANISDLSLDDFPTLNSILEFVLQPERACETPDERVSVAVTSTAKPTESAPLPARSAHASRPQILHLTGTPYEMGLQHGRIQAAEIGTIMESYARLLGQRPEKFPEMAAALADPQLHFGEQELEELQGIADGIGAPVEEVLAHNLGIYPGNVPGCAQFAVTACRNPVHGLIHAANEDSPLALWLPDCLVRTVQARRPQNGIAHLTFSITGQLGGLNGINERGLAISSTLLLDRPRCAETRAGKVHPVIVKRVLEQASDIETAVEILHSFERSGSWSLCLSSFQSDRLWYVEYDGSSVQVQSDCNHVATTNHSLLRPPLADVPLHSTYRLARLEGLLSSDPEGGLSSSWSRQILRDHFDLERRRETAHATMNTICRIDNQVSIVMQPEKGDVWVTPGPMANGSADTFFRLSVDELLGGKQTTSDVGGAEVRPAPTKVAERPEERDAQRKHGDHTLPLPAEPDRVMRRYVLRTVDAPLPESEVTSPQWAGHALILGDNDVARALHRQLQESGATVSQLPATGDPHYVIAELERSWQQHVAPHLFLTVGLDLQAAAGPLQSPTTDPSLGLLHPYLVCQRWVQLVGEASLGDRATLVAATRLGGDFGLIGQSAAILGGGLAGLLKGIHRELPGMTVKVVDASLQETPEDLAAAVCDELAARTPELEIGYFRGRRRVVHAVPQPASVLAPVDVPRGGTWVVTGGARGITAVVALELGRRFGLRMHLLGSSSAPQIDPIWREYTEADLKNLKRTIVAKALEEGQVPAVVWDEVKRAIEIDKTLCGFAEAGVEATYHSCDVSDRDALAAVLARIRETGGPINGVIHGAGVEAACRFDRKQLDKVRATIGVKVGGAAALIELTANDSLRYFIGFGSTSGRFGGLGQTDYSAASDMLCKMCARLRVERPDCRAVGIHWPPWADVGMAARPESKMALQASNLTFMAPAEGAAHVIDELTAGVREGEVLFLDAPGPFDRTDSVGGASQPSCQQRLRFIKTAPLVENFYELDGRGQLVAEARFDPTADPFLVDHLDRGVPILPAAVGVEIAAEAGSVWDSGRAAVVGLRDVRIQNGFRFHVARPQTARAIVRRIEDGMHCEVRTDFLDRHGRVVISDREILTAEVLLDAESRTIPTRTMPVAPSGLWREVEYVEHWSQMDPARHGRIFHGPSLSGLRQLAADGQRAWGRIVALSPPMLAGSRNPAAWLVPSAELDACLWACDLSLCWTHETVQLPEGFDQLWLGRSPRVGEQCTVYLELREQNDDREIFDFTLFGDDNAVLIDALGCRFAKARDAAKAQRATVGQSKSESISAADQSPTVTQECEGLRRSGGVDPDATCDDFPILESVQERPTSNRLVTCMTFDPRTDPFLLDHRFRGKPLLPAVVGMESLLETASLLAGKRKVVALRDIALLKRLDFVDGSLRSARVRAQLDGHRVLCELLSDESENTVYVSATAELSDECVPIEATALRQPSIDFHPMVYPTEGILQHGPSFQCLKELALTRLIGWARIIAPSPNEISGRRPGDRWLLPASVLDACLVACGVDTFIFSGERIEMPLALGALRLGSLPHPAEQCTLQLSFRDQDTRSTTYDFVLHGSDNRIILAVQGYRGVRVTGDAV